MSRPKGKGSERRVGVTQPHTNDPLEEIAKLGGADYLRKLLRAHTHQLTVPIDRLVVIQLLNLLDLPTVYTLYAVENVGEPGSYEPEEYLVGVYTTESRALQASRHLDPEWWKGRVEEEVLDQIPEDPLFEKGEEAEARTATQGEEVTHVGDNDWPDY